MIGQSASLYDFFSSPPLYPERTTLYALGRYVSLSALLFKTQGYPFRFFFLFSKDEHPEYCESGTDDI